MNSLLNIYYKEFSYCKKSRLIKNLDGGFIIINSEDNKSGASSITTKTIGLQNYILMGNIKNKITEIK